VLLEDLAVTSEAVASTSSRLAKIDRLATTLARLRPDEARVAVAYLSGELPQGSIGIGWAALRDLPAATASAPTL
jgi:DNA ligase-1